MVSENLSTLLIGILLGAALMGGGVLLASLLVPRRATATELSANQILEVLAALSEWARKVSGEVAAFDSALEQWDATRQLTESSEAVGNSPTVQAQHAVLPQKLGPLVSANRQLRERLSEARRELERQSATITRLMEQVRTDSLTGLYNRAAFNEHLRRTFAGWRRHGRCFCVAFVDIDHFKQYNDTYGHAVGDAVLKLVANCLRQSVRETDILARYGGEEFVVLLPDTPLKEACRVAERIRANILNATLEIGGRRLAVTASVGVAAVRPGEDAARLTGRADAALYAAKRHGRNRVFWHDGTTARPVQAPSDQDCLPAQSSSSEPDTTDEWVRVCQALEAKLDTLVKECSGVT